MTRPSRTGPTPFLRRQLRHVISRRTPDRFPAFLLPAQGRAEGTITLRHAPAGRQGRDQTSHAPSLKTFITPEVPSFSLVYYKDEGGLSRRAPRRGRGRRRVAGTARAWEPRLPSCCARRAAALVSWL